jgi:SAM-dependent methyltransferase
MAGGPLSRVMGAMHRPVYASRLRALVACVTAHLREGDRVLDVGCGGGALGAAILASPECPRAVSVRGLERLRRGGEPIEVVEYAGGAIPFDDASHDVVIVADVLHHEEEPEALLAECARVAGRLVLLKDHAVAGPLARQRISFIDWAANAPYGVRCLYRYNTPEEWSRIHRRLGLRVVEERRSMRLYPPVVETLFGGRLQYFAALEPIRRDRGPANSGAGGGVGLAMAMGSAS